MLRLRVGSLVSNQLLFAIFLPFYFISHLFLCDSNPTTVGKINSEWFLLLTNPMKKPLGPAANCMGTHGCSVNRAAAQKPGSSGEPRRPPKRVYKRSIVMMGLIGKCNLYWPSNKEYMRQESQSVNLHVRVRFLPLPIAEAPGLWLHQWQPSMLVPIGPEL